MKSSTNKYEKDDESFFATGTSVSSITVGTATNVRYFNYSPALFPDLNPEHDIAPIVHPMDIVKPSKEQLLRLANEAYAALDPDDRDEMDVWDATIKDGLEE